MLELVAMEEHVRRLLARVHKVRYVAFPIQSGTEPILIVELSLTQNNILQYC